MEKDIRKQMKKKKKTTIKKLSNQVIISYVAANEMALMAKLMDLLKKIAAHKNRPARITMIMEKA